MAAVSVNRSQVEKLPIARVLHEHYVAVSSARSKREQYGVRVDADVDKILVTPPRPPLTIAVDPGKQVATSISATLRVDH
jgi:hypothetical protein